MGGREMDRGFELPEGLRFVHCVGMVRKRIGHAKLVALEAHDLKPVWRLLNQTKRICILSLNSL